MRHTFAFFIFCYQFPIILLPKFTFKRNQLSEYIFFNCKGSSVLKMIQENFACFLCLIHKT